MLLQKAVPAFNCEILNRTFRTVVIDAQISILQVAELQNLSQSTMPSLKEMFGVDENGQNLVEVGNENPGEPKTDILLPMCYRNTKWALSIVHALGFGIYREVGNYTYSVFIKVHFYSIISESYWRVDYTKMYNQLFL